MAVKPIPEGYPQVTPYLHLDGAAETIEFYKEVFGARERMQMPAPGGKIGHAELEVGGSLIMLADEFPDMGIRPAAYGGSPVMISLYVEDVPPDEMEKRAAEAMGSMGAGAKSVCCAPPVPCRDGRAGRTSPSRERAARSGAAG